MRKIIGIISIIVICIIIFAVLFVKERGPQINNNDVKEVFILDSKTFNYKKVGDLNSIRSLIRTYNYSIIDNDQSFETTPQNQVKLVLNNGEEYMMMDGNGFKSLIKYPDGTEKVILSFLGRKLNQIDNKYKNKLGIFEKANISKIYIYDKNTEQYKVISDTSILDELVNKFNQSEIDNKQLFETTADNIIKVKLKNGSEYTMMDGDGPQAKIKFPDYSENVVKGPLGPFIGKIEVSKVID